MAKEWILNSAMNRFQLNFKRNVGAVSDEIRKCQPKTVSDWQKYYFSNVRDKNHIEELGRKLYIKITEVISAEVEEITEKDCIDYMFNLVIDRTFDGYMTEIKTIYGQLQYDLNEKIEPAPDEWDRLYNVDFFIKIKNKYIGLQIKPVGGVSHISQIYKERDQQAKTHKKFYEEFGGKVFYVFSYKEGSRKVIKDRAEVVKVIKDEIARLQKG
ncbi:MAG: MjaI family restriction endonuclease [Candidatus Omnitrophica bacterium 4484_171]|nr:MAG: MjaI family restriction endonuclease [Candidatus Omnitrophica bacterium 4484_171]